MGFAACETPYPGTSQDRSEETNERLFQQLTESNILDPVPEEEFKSGPDYSAAVEEHRDKPRAGETAEAGQAESQPESTTEPQEETPPPFNPYLEFGSDIVPYDDDGDGQYDRIMKPFAFPLGLGQRIVNLLRIYGNFAIFAELKEGAPKPEGMQPAGSVVLDLHAGSMIEVWSSPQAEVLSPGTPVPLGDVLYVTGAPDVMREVEHFIRRFGGSGVRQIEIEAKIVEVVTTDGLDIGISPIDSSTPIFGLPSNAFIDSITYTFGNTVATGEALFQISSVHDGLALNAILEAVATHENVSIISRPKVAVREGGRAEIVNISQIPFYNITTLNPQGNYGATLTYKDVGIKLYVIPRIVGTDTIDLNIDIEASQQSGTSVSFSSGPGGAVLSNPVINNRSAKTTVYLEPGQAVILGGLISERAVEQESKVPLIGDLPVIGNLFKSKFTRQEQTNVLFFIRPRILGGSDLRRPFD
jgi:type II secretory pathway component GspD/PulD (secretin)